VARRNDGKHKDSRGTRCPNERRKRIREQDLFFSGGFSTSVMRRNDEKEIERPGDIPLRKKCASKEKVELKI